MKKAAWIVVAAAAARALWFVWRYGVDVPYWDEWGYVVDKLDPATLFEQHNEHRIPVTRVVLYALVHFSRANMRAEMFFNLALLAVLFLLLLREARQHFWLVALIVFSLRQWENLLWGEQITATLCSIFCVLAFRWLREKQIAPAIAAGIGASFTFSSGLAVWPVGLLALLRHRTHALIWSAAGAAVIAFYLHGYVSPPWHPKLGFNLLYLVAALGGSIASSKPVAIACGALLIVFIALLVRPGKDPFALLLIAQGIATALLLVLGRSGFGWEQALSSRYSTLTMLAPIGLWLLLREKPLVWRAAFSALVIGATVDANIDAMGWGRHLLSQRTEMAQILRNYKNEPDSQLRKLLPDAHLIRERARYLEENRLSVFR